MANNTTKTWEEDWASDVGVPTFRTAVTEAGDSWPPCALETLLPSAACPRPGFIVDLALALLQAVVPGNSSLQVLKASQWAFVEGLRPGEDNASLLGLVEGGRVDFSLPNMFLKYERTQRLAYSGPIVGARAFLVYGAYPPPPASLDLFGLIEQPLGLWAVIAVAYTAANLLPWAASFSPSDLLRSLVNRLGPSVAVACLILVNVFFSCLSNYVCILFVVPPKKTHIFSDLEELRSRLLDGQYRLVFHGSFIERQFQAYAPDYYRELKGRGRTQQFFAYNISHFLGEREATETKTVFLTTSNELNYGIFAELGMRIPLGRKELPVHGPMLAGVYYRADGPMKDYLPLSVVQISVLRARFHELEEKYFPKFRRANKESEQLTARSESNLLRKDLGLEDVQGLFAITSLCLLGCLLAWLTELLSFYVLRKSFLEAFKDYHAAKLVWRL